MKNFKNIFCTYFTLLLRLDRQFLTFIFKLIIEKSYLFWLFMIKFLIINFQKKLLLAVYISDESKRQYEINK